MVWSHCSGGRMTYAMGTSVSAKTEFNYYSAKSLCNRPINKIERRSPPQELLARTSGRTTEVTQKSEVSIAALKQLASQDGHSKANNFTFSRRNALRKRTASSNPRSTANKQLAQLLQNKYALLAFRHFLKLEYSDNDLLFWLDCEEYKKCEDLKLLERAEKIVEKYMLPDSTNQVNLSHATCKFARAKACDGRRDAFEKVQQRIFKSMTDGAFKRFATQYPSLIRYVDSLGQLTLADKPYSVDLSCINTVLEETGRCFKILK